MGFFEGLDAEQYDRQYSDQALVKRIVGYLAPQSKRLAIVAGLVVVISAAGAFQPVLVSRGLDMIEKTSNRDLIFLLSAAVMLVGLISWTANWARRRQTSRAIADTLVNLATDAFKAAAHHDLSFYDKFSSGRILSRITSDTRDFGQLVVIVTDLVSQVFEALILAVVLVRIEWRLALVMFTIIPVVFVMALSYRRLARVVTKRGMQAMAEVNSTIKETISGIAVAKNFRQEEAIFTDFEKANLLSYSVNVRRGLVLAMVFPSLNALGGLMTAALVYTGGMSAAQGLVSAGSWYLFLLSLDRFLFPVMNLSSFWTQVQSGLSAAERVFALIDAEPAVVQTADREAPRLTGKIDFDHVSFWYKPNEPVLNDFSLRVEAGETLALVGHTGAGKSSIARLVARFYEFQRGKILVDGLDIRELNLAGYRRQLGIVSQVPFLFSGSILENIQYGAPGITEEEALAMGRQIGDGEWLDALPDGLRTQVGERGARLSMGQRQLVSLMRVLVQKPAIFILDEATASIDPFTEWQIQQALNLILKQTTSLLIAHRLSTVKSADRIIVLDHGKILEEGSHDGLLSQGGQYADLYNTYFRHQSLSYVEQARDAFAA